MPGPRRQNLSHAPRRRVHADAVFTALLARNLTADARMMKIPPGARWVLLVAVLQFTDGDGKFWPKLGRLAEVAGVSRSIASEHLAKAIEQGLLSRQPYARPDGKQGSSTYRWDPGLVPVVQRDLEAAGVDRNKGKRQLIDGVWHTYDGTNWIEDTR